MDRTLIAWNVPNMVTIPLMAFIGFLVVGTIWQLFMRGRTNQPSSDAGGGY